MAEIKRHIAYKVKVKDILDNEYIKQEGDFAPSYVNVNGMQVARANIIAAVVSKNEDQLVVDDGSASITLRSFDNNYGNVTVGDFVIIIGKPREFDNERYLVPEIIKKIHDKEWVELRKLELPETYQKPEPTPEAEAMARSPSTDVYNLIKELDKGQGADVQELVNKNPNAEKVVVSLLEKGEIFEVKPGKVKVLE
ncbi:MAG: hypothetical protein KJ601_01235 [Nanoarchaeota archaeon]|nr:hypothetical protein [Nanoarchaeota archaeon]MBU1705061.1 hypothetical protein [Nanoarchaeota archaeon]